MNAGANEPNETNQGLQVHMVTLLSISVVVYIIQNVLHEGLGHAGACFLTTGCKAIAVSTAHFESNKELVSGFGIRWVAFAGSLVNLVIGLVCLYFHRKLQNISGNLRYFLWLSMAVNLFTAAGYPFFSGVAGIGDWKVMIKGLEPIWLWRISMTLFGVSTYMLCVWLCLKELSPYLSSDKEVKEKEGRKLTLLPYLVGSFTSTIGALLNPHGSFLIFTSASSVFGGTSALAWMASLYGNDRLQKPQKKPLQVTKSLGWILSAILLLGLHIVILGPSFYF